VGILSILRHNYSLLQHNSPTVKYMGLRCLFICRLFNDSFSVTNTVLYNVQWKGAKLIWIGKELERSGRGLILRYYAVIRIDGPKKTTKSLSEDSRCSGRYLSPKPPEYEAGVLITRPWRWFAMYSYE
jgi:hypothetical protein